MFEVGDKVIVNPPMSKENYTLYWAPEMDAFIGKVATVSNADLQTDGFVDLRLEGAGEWEFSTDHLEKVEQGPTHYSSPNGDVWSTVGAFFSNQSRIDHHRLNAVEYIIRCPDKGGVEDLKKAKVNLDRAIEMMEENND